MDLHRKFQTSPIIDLSLVLDSKNYQSTINNLIKVFNTELLTSTIDENKLKTYHMIDQLNNRFLTLHSFLLRKKNVAFFIYYLTFFKI